MIKDLSGTDQASINQIEYEATTTDLNNILHKIENEFENMNITGVLLISDGIYNHGSSPIYSNFSFPIYTLGIGDTTEKEDIIIKSLNHNKIVYQGNKFRMQAEVYNKGFSGKTVMLSLRNKGKTLESKYLDILTDKGIQTVEFEIEAAESGMQRFEIILNPLASEFSIENNTLNAYVEVVEGKEKILLLAQAPHPDIKVLKSIIEKNNNYEIEIGIPGFGKMISDKYDLAILHQLPDNGNTYNDDIERLISNAIPVLYVLGSGTNLNKFNILNNTLNIKPLRNQSDNVFVSLNVKFGLFNINEATKNIVNELPPAIVPFGEYSLKGESEIIFYQRIGKITTDKPLLIIHNGHTNKEAVLVGEGLWKWRLNEYFHSGNFDGIDDLINKIIQYLSAKEDRRKFKVYPVRNENWDNEAVIFENEIYNDIYEKIYDQKIDLTLIDEEENSYEYSYIISKVNSQFKISGLNPGVYQYIARTILDDEIKTVEGTFSIKKLLVEISNLKADFNMLRELSRRSSGTFYTISNIDDLADDIRSSEVHSLIHSSESYSAIINLKWIFFLILLLITLEWGLRKYLGGY
jgi:hypothetical protein